MRGSIQSRLLISASIILFFFLGFAGFILDAAYKSAAQVALQDRLQIHLYSILANAELSKNMKLIMSNNVPEPRFSQTDSGLYASIFQLKNTVWRSLSSTGYPLRSIANLKPGKRVFHTHTENANSTFLELHFQAILENRFNRSMAFEFVVTESTKTLEKQIDSYRSILWQWLGGIGVLLLISQYLVLRRSLKPLRNIVSDLNSIQQGERQHLEHNYSVELKDIATTLNQLIDNERNHLQRYRNTLADLAHSLKTPLTVLTGLYEQKELTSNDLIIIQKQTIIMRQLVDYQLNKAAAKGHQTLTEAFPLKPIVRQLLDSLDKVHAEKGLSVSADIEELSVYAEKGDMFEIFGNILDNAYKWANNHVSVSVHALNSNITGVRIIIEDDGPGISNNDLTKVLGRGIRADQSTPGHGIGLAVINELVQLYKGSMKSGRSAEGGQRWEISLPCKIERLNN